MCSTRKSKGKRHISKDFKVHRKIIKVNIKILRNLQDYNYRTTLHVKKGSFSYAVKITNRELLPICKIYYVANVKIFAHREDEI